MAGFASGAISIFWHNYKSGWDSGKTCPIIQSGKKSIKLFVNY